MLVKTTMRRNWGHIGPKTLSMEMFLIWLLTFRIWTVYSLLEERQKFILLTLFETFPSYSSVFSREIMIVPVGHHDAIITKSKWHISWFSLEVKASPCNVGDLGSIPGLGRSPGGGHGNPLQYSCLENPHGQRSLVGYSLWGHKESETTEWLSIHRSQLKSTKNPFLYFSDFSSTDLCEL